MREQPTREELRQAFIARCVARDAQGIMHPDDLLQRMDITINELKRSEAASDKRLPVVAADCLRGALIRLSQAYGDVKVSAKVYELVSITTDIAGL